MKQALVAVALGALVALTSQSAWAISVQADIPVAAGLTDKAGGVSTTRNASSVSGSILGLNVGLLGIQLENYKETGKTAGISSSLEVTMYDLMLNLPIPFIDIGIGAGIGQGKFSGPAFAGSNATTADLTQTIVQLGIPFAILFDVHLGYRMLSGSFKTGVAPAQVKHDLTGSTTTLGLTFGF
jgi:hypothetical protein